MKTADPLRRVAVQALILFLMLTPGMASASCAENRVSIRGPAGQAAFTVEIADDPQERALGLMHRSSMPRFSGMLFVFDAPQRAVFWMENTLIPLDMIFVDGTGTIQRVHANAIPMDRTGIDGGEGITHVLEINGGMAARLGIEPGAVLQHPSFDPAQAAWPCAQ